MGCPQEYLTVDVCGVAKSRATIRFSHAVADSCPIAAPSRSLCRDTGNLSVAFERSNEKRGVCRDRVLLFNRSTILS